MESPKEPLLVVFSTVSMSIVPSNSSEVEHRDAGSVTVTMKCLDIQMITWLLLPPLKELRNSSHNLKFSTYPRPNKCKKIHIAYLKKDKILLFMWKSSPPGEGGDSSCKLYNQAV